MDHLFLSRSTVEFNKAVYEGKDRTPASSSFIFPPPSSLSPWLLSPRTFYQMMYFAIHWWNIPSQQGVSLQNQSGASNSTLLTP